MRAVGRIGYGLVAPRGWCELEEGNGGEAIWEADVELRSGNPRSVSQMGSKSSVPFQEGPKLQSSEFS